MRMRVREGFCFLMILIASIHVVASQMTHHKKCLEATIAECFPGEELFMESEVSYRFLAEARAKSISYGALTPDKGICKGSTPAYRSCLPDSNKGSDRGCKSTYRCRSGSP
ncbi:hypothetical protein PVL29_000022 [Vitis rotundifolia]|uniref:Protein RALF-like 33 n=1 Tax=Vitis rotundifolia TaxID=103349 RepID=A0AA39AHI4_VITRO|nr:hypothetical protein PVL29_000022 [Vitis rotundifolia]